MVTKVKEGDGNGTNVDGIFELVIKSALGCMLQAEEEGISKLTHPRKVRSAAKYTLGSTRTGT